MVLRLYVDLLSQPCRAVALFLRVNGIPHEEVLIPIRKAQHQTPEFAQINPFKRLPAIDHDGFKITESTAILTYLTRVFSVPDHWYPKNDVRKQASIESYMSWQHLNLRLNGTQYFRHVISAYASGTTPDEKKLSGYSAGLQNVLTQIDTIWLKDRSYIATDELSIADLMAITELEQPGFDMTAGYPKIATYMNLVKSNLQPHYDEVHQVARIMGERMKKPRTQAKL